MGRRFFAQAEVDLAFAHRNREIGGHYIAAHLAYQAAEKALKAAHWHLRAEEPEWSHHLIALTARVAELGGEPPRPVEEAVELLTPILGRARYPSGRPEDPIPAQLVEAQEALAAIEAAAEVIAWVRLLRQRPPGRPRRTTRSSRSSRA